MVTCTSQTTKIKSQKIRTHVYNNIEFNLFHMVHDANNKIIHQIARMLVVDWQQDLML